MLGSFSLDLERERIAAVRAGDIAALKRFLSEDLVFLHSSGRVDSRDSYLQLLETGKLKYTDFEVTNMRLGAVGSSAAIVVSDVAFRAVFGGKDLEVKSTMLVTWIKEGNWRVAGIGSTPQHLA